MTKFDGQSPFHGVAKHGHVDVIRTLLLGGNINEQNKNGQTALELASFPDRWNAKDML